MSEELDRLYERALELPPDARAAFAAQASDDEGLRAELLTLIAVGDKAENFFARLGSAVLSPPLLAEAMDDAIGSRSDSPRSSRYPGEPVVLEKGVVIGRYSIVGLLGRGGMGTVYRARDTRLDRDAALKFPYPHLTSDADAEERLLAEARAFEIGRAQA